MDPKLKAKWLSALRSGNYLQGHGRLRRDERKDGKPEFCCLGVLCDVSGMGAWDGSKFSTDTGITYTHFLPPEMEHIVPFSTQNKLADLNDKDVASFAQIADWIEERL